MKQLGAILGILSLLSLAPAAFAADGGVLGYQPGESRPMGREASDTLPSKAGNLPRSVDQTWHAGDLRPSGLYMGPDGMLHNVPKSQDPSLRIY